MYSGRIVSTIEYCDFSNDTRLRPALMHATSEIYEIDSRLRNAVCRIARESRGD